MADLISFPTKLDRKKFQCRAIIETPKNRRNKFDYDPESNVFKLGGLLPEGMMFPFDFGFIPATLGGDGDPLDVMVLMDEPVHETAHNPKRVNSTRRQRFHIPAERRRGVLCALRGKKFKLKSQGGPKPAMAIIKEGIKAFEKQSGQ